jgi:hypothetical protein
MARQTAPKKIGVLETDVEGLKNWITEVYDAGGKIYRLEARKPVLDGKKTTQKEKLVQLPLVDVNGIPF